MLNPQAALRKDLTSGKHVTFEHRHFAAIAAILREMGADAATINAWAYHLALTNPRFDRARFLKACGVES